MERGNTQGGGKKIWLRAVIGFFTVMALLTFFSATIRNISLPRVTAAAPVSGILQKVVTADGTFDPSESVSVDMDYVCGISSVNVAAGDTVKAGDALMTLDESALAGLLKQEQDVLAKLENNREKTENGYMPQDLTQLQVSLDLAKRELQNAQENVIYVQGNVSSGTADPGALEEAKQAVQDAQDQVTIKTGELERAREENARQKESSELDLANMDIDIAAQQKKVDELAALAESGGKITSPVGGVVGQINIKAGENTVPAQPLLTISDLSGGMEFTADVTKDEAALIPADAEMDIRVAGVKERINAVLREKKESAENPGEMTTLVLEASSSAITQLHILPGQAGDIRYARMTQNYSTTVPNGAVREDSTGSYVLVADEKDTPLGKQQVLRRVGVTVEDSDAFRSAVSGALSPRDAVVGDSDKPVAEGDAVLVGP